MAGIFGGGSGGGGLFGGSTEKSTMEERQKIGRTFAPYPRQDALMQSRYPQMFMPGRPYRMAYAKDPRNFKDVSFNFDPAEMAKRRGRGGSGTVLGG